MSEQKESIQAAEPSAQATGAEAEEHSAFGDVREQSEKQHLDFFTALVLIGVSVWVIVTSQGYFQQQLKRRMATTFYESAGFMPTVFAVFLLVMGVILLVQSLRKASVRARLAELWQALTRTVHSRAVYKTLGGLFIFGLYIYALLGKMDFGVASVLVLFATLLYSYFDPKNLPKVLLKSALISLLSVAGIVALFQYAFSVPMP